MPMAITPSHVGILTRTKRSAHILTPFMQGEKSMSTPLNDVYNTELSLIYSQLPQFPTDEELELVDALVHLVEIGAINVVIDDNDGEVKFLSKVQEEVTLH